MIQFPINIKYLDQYYSPLSGSEIKKEWSYTFTSPYVFMVWWLISTREKFTFIRVSVSRMQKYN
jgi:hypothetical protein